MSQNRSDYTSPLNWSFADKLPEVLRNPLIDAMSSSLFDRFVTRPETQRIIGSVGRRNPSSVVDDRVVEESTFKQAFQLQPIIQAQVGLETLYYTYEDLMRICERNGIDTSKVEDWQSTDLFNFALPIDLDKYINYTNYMWVDETTLPQYVTIKNNQILLQSRLDQRVKHYIDLLDANDPSRLEIWPNIERGLNTVYTQVPEADRIEIQNLNRVLDDPIHPPYVYSPYAEAKFGISNAWQRENRWVHKLHVTDPTRAKRAQMPILEFSDRLQLTAWTYTKLVWKYRKNSSQPWQDTKAEPTDDELFNRFPMVAANATNDTFSIAGDNRTLFPVGKQFTIEGSNLYNGTWTVASVSYNGTNTIIGVTTNVIAGTVGGRLVPYTTNSQGDPWENFFEQWMFVGVEQAVPTIPPANVVQVSSYTFTASQGQTLFTLPEHFRYVMGADVLNVYVNGRRQYGNYDEVTDLSFRFLNGRNAGDKVTVRLGARTMSDHLRMRVPVRINEAGTIAERCLVHFRPTEQVKNHRNDYPLFDIVDASGNATYRSSSLIRFQESSTAPINLNFGKRIVVDSLTKDYQMYIDVAADRLSYFLYNGKPTSVWQPVKEEYVPKKVDGDGNTSDTGVYEIPRQLTNNVHHELRPAMKFSELFAHFRSIALNQAPVDPQFGNLDVLSGNHLLDTIDYGVGGSIQDHNFSFDTFVSTLVSSDHQYSSVIEFARDQYRELLVDFRNRITEELVQALSSASSASIVDLKSYVASQTISSVENDSSMYKLYGDSTVGLKYNSVKNWIATIPFLGFAKPVKPMLLEDARRGILTLIHHDGHVSVEEIGTTTSDMLFDRIVHELNPSKTKPTVPDASVKVGQLYLDSTAKKLYRLSVVAVSKLEPLLSNYPDGVFWVNTTDNKLYIKANDTWVVHSNVLNDAWTLVDIASILLNSVYNLETELYEGALKVTQTYDLLGNPYGLSVETQRATFEAWCKRNDIVQPYQGNYRATDPFSWYYADIDPALFHQMRNNATIVEPGASADMLYMQCFNTAYPNLMPWKLQGFEEKPLWWDEEYKATDRRWKPVMWSNIKAGIIPVGRTTPTGTVSTGTVLLPGYKRVSVNITNVTTVDGYGPDDLLPPYWVPSNVADNIPGIADEVMLNCEYDLLTNVSKNWFEFGEMGPNECSFYSSIDYLYDLLVAQYLDQPVRVVASTLGGSKIDINGLQVVERTNRVMNHRDIQFHGDVNEDNQLILVDGVNQWYTQFFRYNNLDTNATNYKEIWKNWTTHLAYNVGNFLVDNTLSISSGQIEIAPNDYTVDMKVNRRVTDKWIDSLYIDIDQPGTRKEMPLGYARDWKFLVSIRAPISREVQYYPVRKFRISTDVATNTFRLSDHTLAELGWNEGQPISVDTGMNGIMPAGIDVLNYYYVMPVSEDTFKVALSVDDIKIGKFVEFQTEGTGVLYAGELERVFYAFEREQTDAVWRHYTIDKDRVLTFTDSVKITGVQNLVDFIDGYSAYLMDQGFVFNDSSAIEYDSATNRQLNWQFETERIINTLYLTGKIPNLTSTVKDALGTLDVNPFRNHLWVKHDSGVVSSFDATDAKQTKYRAIVYNSFGNLVHTKYYHVLREDKITHMSSVNPQTFVDDVATNDFATIQYSLTNIGGAHIFFDEYEHVIVFKDYAISGDLIYDSYLGINVPRVNVYFEKQVGNTKRPNVGGYVLTSNGKLTQNWEYTVSNITKYYDTFTVNENANFVNYARGLLGYSQNVSYMKDLGVTAKSQFLFYKGLIQSKGTIGSINAFTNNSQLKAAAIDEFWAYKSHEFGENRPKVSYQLNLKPEDTSRSHLKLQFVVGNEKVGPYFEAITNQDNSRWVEYPNQRAAILENENVSFETKVDAIDDVKVENPRGSITHKYIKHVAAVAIKLITTQSGRHEVSKAASETITLPFYYPVGAKSLMVYVNGANVDDYTELSSNRVYVPGSLDKQVIIAKKSAELVEGVHYKRLNTRLIALLGDTDKYGLLQLVRMSSNLERNVPVSLIDRTAKTTIVDMTTWDPAAGYYADDVLMQVDSFSDTDPAVYNAIADSSRRNTNRFWNQPEVGTVWMDTGSFAFVEYHDSVGRSTADMLLNWGRMEDWSDPAVYTWVESFVPPEEWTDGTPYQEVYRRTRTAGTIAVTNGVINIVGVTLVDGDEVFFMGAAPTLVNNRAYVVKGAPGSWKIVDRDDSSIQALPNGFNATIMKANFDDNWTTVRRQRTVIEAAEVNISSKLVSTPFREEEYAMYVDGQFVIDGYTDSNGNIDLTDEPEALATIQQNPFGQQISVNIKTGVIDGLPTTEPAAFDLSGMLEQEFVGCPTVQIERHDELTGATRTVYYFWVRDSSIQIAPNQTTSMIEALVDQHVKPYVVFDNPVVRNGKTVLTQLIGVGLSGLVTSPNRFLMRLVHDDTLRDKAVVDDNGVLLKPLYTEWKMFRQEQESAVDRRLWDKITESIVGYKLSDPSIPVPALDRVVYDKLNGTNTRFGLDVGQAFVNGTQAIETIYAELNNPTVDYSPNDIDLFLATHDFSTPAKAIEFMNDLYTTIASQHVNRIFFSVLMDALSIVGADYSNAIIKTSGIAVRSSMPLNVNGAYDE